ncbi:fumarylacetoacetate hydrolase family protein [Irregularibacter muris]|uniref:Fumarylacetoacetate hydrolase family protein n=1 Tax=Irregularibacter muris TaxID=1796619 RepID=A0AAE3HFT4_9FIRM|nr:fumarylacetoacetate hydrolase family protein [Irregularibacter muris]MCR1899366.1 fumarylacetoacetate hydrolase family protein [Irregularibacter muris]
MKLLNFMKNQEIRIGVKTDCEILDINKAGELLNIEMPNTLDDVIRKNKGKAIEKIVENSKGNAELYLKEEEIEFAPCIMNPQKIICVGLNYISHIDELQIQDLPKSPVLFSKFNNALAAHNEAITIPKNSEKIDYEAELVIVIGKEGKNIEESEALSYVFGYTAGNDFSARDLQFISSQWLIGKSFDGSAPVGPYIIPAKGINPQNLKIQSKVNGEIRQSSNTNKMIFSCAAIISYISKHMTLKPGDIIFTGTPEGVTLGYTTEEKQYLKSGDKVEIIIENIGVLSNTLE